MLPLSAWADNNQQGLLGGTVGNLLNSVTSSSGPLSGVSQQLSVPLAPGVAVQNVHSAVPQILPNSVGSLLPMPNSGVPSPLLGGVQSFAVQSSQLSTERLNGRLSGMQLVPSVSRQQSPTYAPIPVFVAPSLESTPGLVVANVSLRELQPASISGQASAIHHSAQTKVQELAPGHYHLDSGSLLVSPHHSRSTTLSTDLAKILVGRKSDVLVSFDAGVLRVQNLDGVGKDVLIELNQPGNPSPVVTLRPGHELVVASRHLDWDVIRPADGIGRRNQVLIGDGKMAVSEISLASVLKNQKLLSASKKSEVNAQRQIYNRVLKTAVILDGLRGKNGFHAVPQALASTGDVVRSIAPNTVLGTVRDTGNQVLALLDGEDDDGILPLPNVPVSPETGMQLASNGATNAEAASTTSGASTTSSPANTAVAYFEATRPSLNQLLRLSGLNRAEAAESSRRAAQHMLPGKPMSGNKDSHLSAKESFGSQQNNQVFVKKAVPAVVVSKKPTGRVGVTTAGGAWQPGRFVDDALDLIKHGIQSFPEFVLAAGAVIASLLFISLTSARSAFIRARQLGSVNRKLTAEVRERKSLEQKANQLNENLERQLVELDVLNRQLQVARDQAVEGSRLKSEFVANISHEIRTPITAVLGMNQLLLNTKLDRSQNEYASSVNESAQSLLGVINDILDFSKIEAGKLEVHSAAFSITALIKEVGDMLASSAKEKGLLLFMSIDPTLAKTLHGDQLRLRQVLLNLTGNAIKFTDHGEVVIQVERMDDPSGSSRVRFTVQDTGIGIEPQSLAGVFEPFVQVDGSTTRRYSGTGLGLSISKHLVELMGGKIQAASHLGQGSLFSFDLPLGDSGENQGHQVSVASKKRVLIASGQPYSSKLMAKQLENAGFATDLVAGTAMEMASLKVMRASRKYSAVVVDQASCAEVYGAITANKSFRSIPVLLVKASDSEQPSEFSRATLFTSPLDAQDIVDWLASTAGNKIKQKVSKMADTSVPNPRSVDVSGAAISVLVAEDSPVLQRMAKHLLEKLGCQVEIVSNGQEAVNAMANKNYKLILMDWQMPEMDGLTATRIIREKESQSGTHIPIIALTANAMQGDRNTCLQAGMDDYLSKPFKLEDLHDVIKKYSESADKSKTES